jgi:hypothetical protein
MAFEGRINDICVFRRGTRPFVEWKVVEIESSFDAVRWNKNGTEPFFVRLERLSPNKKQRKKRITEYIWASGASLTVVEKVNQ